VCDDGKGVTDAKKQPNTIHKTVPFVCLHSVLPYKVLIHSFICDDCTS
jgi:hypothetical protein